MEQWRAIPSLPGYEASDQGRIRSVDREFVDSRGRKIRHAGRILALAVASNGYIRFSITGTCLAVHRAVLEAFVGAAPSPLHHGAHRDGCKANNRLDNLRWATPVENAADKRVHGTMYQPKGEQHPQARFTDAEVLLIKKRLSVGESQTQIARDLRVDSRTIHSIASGKTWRHVKLEADQRAMGKVA